MSPASPAFGFGNRGVNDTFRGNVRRDMQSEKCGCCSRAAHCIVFLLADNILMHLGNRSHFTRQPKCSCWLPLLDSARWFGLYR